MLERLQKIISRAGVTSRRHAEQLIVSGQVSVNGTTVTELGAKADPEQDTVRVGARVIHAAGRHAGQRVYVLLHKPPQVVATMLDPQGRASLRELLRHVRGRVFPVGRLDYHSSGALLLTSDGELAARILKMSARMPQTWVIKVKGLLDDSKLGELRRTAGVRIIPIRGGSNAWYEVILRGVRIDDVRSTLARMTHPVEKAKRVKLADMELASLPPGKFRYLAGEELARLRRAVTRAESAPAAGGARRPQRKRGTQRRWRKKGTHKMTTERE